MITHYVHYGNTIREVHKKQLDYEPSIINSGFPIPMSSDYISTTFGEKAHQMKSGVNIPSKGSGWGKGGQQF